MHIALTNPYSWPEVRRGSERFISDLAEFLAGRGHKVTIVSTHLGPNSHVEERGVTYIRVQQRLRRGVGRWVTPLHAFTVQCYGVLKELDIDAVHCMTYYDAFAAARAYPMSSRARIVVNIVGIINRRYFRSVPHDKFLFERSLRRADSVTAPSRCSAESLNREFGRSARVIPPPVNLRRFSPQPTVPDGGPTFLFVGDVEERRKGAGLLMRALPALRAEIPGARLVFSGRAGDARRAELLGLVDSSYHDAVTFLGVGAPEDLPKLYSAASVTVLPAIWEALGLALIESLACGTPVVGCDHGGMGDVISKPEIGRLFSPGSTMGEANNAEGLTRTLVETYALSNDPGTAERCIQHAREFSWDRLGPELERLYLA